MNEIMSVLSKVQTDFIELAPQLALAVAIIIVGTFIAYVLKWLSSSVVKWVKPLIPENIYQDIFTEHDIEKLSKLLGRIVFFITIFLTIATALKKMGLEIISNWFQSVASFLPNIIIAIVIFIFGWKLKNFLKEILSSSLEQVNFAQSQALSKAVSWLVFIISSIVALEQVGLNIALIINLSIMLSGIITGGIVLTFALGAKSNIADILSCYQLNRHLRIGQNVKITSCIGTVKSIGPVFVVLETQEGEVVLPGSFFNKNTLLIQKQKA